MRTKRVIYNTSTAAIVQILTFAVGLILPRMLLVTYGSTINGLRASIVQLISYFYIVEMGLGGALTFALYKPLQQNNIEEINGIIAASQKAYKQIGMIFSVLVLGLTCVYPFIVEGQGIETYTIVFLILSSGVAGIINYFTLGGYTVLLTASQKGYILSIIKIIYLVFNTLLLVYLISLKIDIGIAYFISLVSNIFQVMITRIYIKCHYPYINTKVKPNQEALSKRYDVLIHQISGMIVSNIPVLILTLYGDLKEVSVYCIYMMIFSSITMVLGIFSGAFMPVLGEIIATKDSVLLKKTYSQYELMYYMIAAYIYSCAYILGISFIQIYTKGVQDANYIDNKLLLLFCIIGVMTSWKSPQSTIISAAGHFRETRHRAIIEVIITLVGSCILGYLYGLNGILLGTIIALGYRSIDIVYAQKITGHKVSITFKRLARIGILEVVVSIILKKLVENKIDSFGVWVIYAIGISLIISGIIIGINYLCEPDEMKRLIARCSFLTLVKKIKGI